MELQAIKLQNRSYKRVVIPFLVALIALFSPFKGVFASATPTVDMTSNEIPLVYQLLQNPPNFTQKRYNNDTELWYAPIKITNTITGVNSIKMKFKATALEGQPFVCPDTGIDGGWSRKFAEIELHKIADASMSYDNVFLLMGINPPNIDPFPLATNSIKIYNGTYGGGTNTTANPNWRKNTDGTCSLYLTEPIGDQATLINQIDSGWYILRFAGTAVSSTSNSNFNSYVNAEDNDTMKISLLGDNSYDTVINAEGVNGAGSPFVLWSNYIFNGYAPFVPSFPYMEFSYTAPPIIEKEGSCNPFSGDISSAFLNTEFSLKSCLSQIATLLFIPSSTSTAQFSNLVETIKQKPPFGWVVGTFDSLYNINTVDAEPIFILEQVTPITDTIFDPIKLALSWLLYFTFAFYLFKRFKDITI